MTHTTTPPALTVLPGPDRTIPQILIDIAVLAIRRGAQRVSLLHEGLDADFPAPIGWLLRIRRLNDAEKPKDVSVDFFGHQVGCDLSDIVAPSWLSDAEDQTVLEDLVELFEVGARNGWDVSYERDMFDHAIITRISAERGFDFGFGMRHKLEANATNWFYCVEPTVPGNQVSTTLTLSAREGEPRDEVAFSDDGGNHRQVDQAHIDTLIRQVAPNFAPVACFDDDREEWTL